MMQMAGGKTPGSLWQTRAIRFSSVTIQTRKCFFFSVLRIAMTRPSSPLTGFSLSPSGRRWTDRKFNPQSTSTQYALNPLSSSTPCANPNQSLTSGQRPLLFGVRRDLIRGTSGKCTLIAIWIWQPTPLAARRQRLIHTNPRSAACAISAAQDYHPNVWSYSSSGIGSASAPAECGYRS